MNFGTWFVNGWGLAALLAFLISGWAVREHLRYTSQFRSLQRHILDGVGLLSSIPTPADFYQRIRTSGQALEANPVLGKRWREYRATLLAARGDKPLRSPVSAGEFFNEDLYRSSDIDVRAYEALPNQFVGIGLCMTFFGLIFSLFIAQNVITASAESATIELSNLLQAASFKFITSVVALVASVVFVFAKNRRLFKTEKDISAFCEQLERLIPPVTPEELAEESNQELARQGEQLEAANRTLATGIADALEQKLTSAMIVATEPLIQTVRTMTERLSDVNRSALEHMAQRFSETLAGAAKEHSERIAELLKSSADAIGEAPAHIRAASTAMSHELQQTVAAVDKAFDTWSLKMTEAGDVAASTLKDRASEQADFIATALRQEGAALLEGISAVADELISAPQRITAAGEAFAKAADHASASVGSAVEEAGSRISSALDGAAGKVEGSVSSMHELIAQTDVVTDRMEAISGDLSERITSLFKGASEVTARLSDIAADVTVAGDAAQHLGRVADRMEQLSEDLTATARSVASAAEQNHVVTKDTQLLVIKLGERAAAMERELEGLDASLGAAFEKVGGGFEQLSSRTADYMAQLDTGFAQALDRFGGAIRDFDQTLERLAHVRLTANEGGMIAPRVAE